MFNINVIFNIMIFQEELAFLTSTTTPDDSPTSTASDPSPPPNSLLDSSNNNKTRPVAAGHSVLHLLQERIQNYSDAEANALSCGETSRARR